MKKSLRLLLLTAFAVVICFSSCTKKAEKLIVGKWKVTSARCSNIDEDYIEGDKGETWKFDEDGTFTGYFNLFESEIECDYVCEDNTLELSGGDLKMNDGYEKLEVVYIFDIDDITKKEMSLSGKIKVTYTDLEDGYTETETVSGLKYELEKK